MGSFADRRTWRELFSRRGKVDSGFEGGAVSEEAKVAQEPEKESPEPVDLSTRLALSVEEAALASAISEKHLRNHLCDVPHVHIGNRVVITVKPFEDWLREQVTAEKASADRIAGDVLREFEKK